MFNDSCFMKIMSLENIKLLREKTGAGMVECKKALEEAGQDIDKAAEILRKKGIAKAAKRGDRDTSEGIILVETNENHTKGYMLQLTAETDFVAKNEKFIQMAKDILAVIRSAEPGDTEKLNAADMNGNSVADNLSTLSGTIGEKMEIKNFAILKGETVSAYSHLGGRIGVLVSLDKNGIIKLGVDIAMQIAAQDPKYLKPEDVDPGELEKEKSIYKEQLIKEGKPENIIDKIIIGKVNKYYEEVCLIKQEFIKDDKKKVEDILDGINITKYIRFSL